MRFKGRIELAKFRWKRVSKKLSIPVLAVLFLLALSFLVPVPAAVIGIYTYFTAILSLSLMFVLFSIRLLKGLDRINKENPGEVNEIRRRYGLKVKEV